MIPMTLAEVAGVVRGRISQTFGCTGFYLNPPSGSCRQPATNGNHRPLNVGWCPINHLAIATG